MPRAHAVMSGCRDGHGSSMRIVRARRARLATPMVPPSPSTMFFAIGRPRPVPVRLVVKYGSKTRRRSSGAMPVPRSLHRDAAGVAVVRRPRATRTRRSGRRRGRGAVARRTACRAFDEQLTSAVRSRSASVDDRRQRRSRSRASIGRRRRRPCAAGRSVPAERVEVGRLASSNSDRPREVEHVVHDAVEPRDLLVDVGHRLARCPRRRDSAAAACAARALMIISGLRTSCAMTVDSRPSDDRRSLCAASRWKRAIESVSVLKVVASSRASSSSQRRRLARRDLARQVAGGGHLAHRRRDRGQRTRDRARHGVAEERRQQHGEDRRHRQRGVDACAGTAAARCAIAARARDRRAPPLRRRAVGVRRAAGAADILVVADDGRATTSADAAAASSAASVAAAASPRGRRRPARRRPRCRVARLKLRRPSVVEAEADAQRAEHVRAVEADAIGTVATCSTPPACGQNSTSRRPPSAARDARVAMRLRRAAPAASTRPRPVGDDQQVGGHLAR